MRNRTKYFLIALLAATIAMPFSALAQSTASPTKAKPSVTVDLNSGIFTGTTGLPFDVEFNISGTTPGTTRRIEMKYRVKQSSYHKSWMQPEDLQWKSVPAWTYDGDPTKDQPFNLACGAIYPNTTYEFQFSVERIPNLNATQITALNTTLYNLIDDFAKHYAIGDISILNMNLNAALSNAAGTRSTITKMDGTPYVVDLMSPELSPTTTNLMAAEAAIPVDKNNIIAQQTAWTGYDKRALFAAISALRAHPEVLDAESKTLWNSAVNSGIPDYGGLKFQDVSDLLTSVDVTPLFDGSKKINGSALADASQFNLASIKLLLSFFADLRQFNKTDGTAYFPAPLITDAQHLSTYLNNITGYNNDIATQQGVISDALKNFPDLISDKFIYTTYTVTDSPNIDVTSENNAYIGLDYGTAYAFNYNQLFLYEGVNFYFVPVNKDAPLSTIKGRWRNIGKRVSIHFGLTQSLIDVPDKRYEALLGSAGSLLVGAGVRFNKIMRVNLGALFFYEKDVNPIVDNKSLQVRPAISLTFDLNVAKALGAFGKALNINQ
ncbi:MAG: hypothetical protein JSU01_24005 [Bacteroidetes bacterium]|nr:hypothetical protein [Bacteroidota bacterium]